MQSKERIDEENRSNSNIPVRSGSPPNTSTIHLRTHPIGDFFGRVHTFPLALLSLTTGQRLLAILGSYCVAIPALWFFYPHLHNAASMVLPIVCSCWLFRYRGLLLSMLSPTIAIWLIYTYLQGNLLPRQIIIERAVAGFIMVIFIGLTICWLRTAIDLVHQARQQTLAVEEKRLQLALAYEQQRKINEMKDLFLLNVSHELYTPLTVLGGSLELLKEYHQELDTAQRSEMLTHAVENQSSLVNLVNQVLDTTAAMSEFSLAKPGAICLHQFLQDILAQLTPEEAAAYTISLHVSEHIMAWADAHLLRQVVQNVLNNAFKYVPRQTEIHIEATQETPSSAIRLSIQDAGPGIPREELPQLFEKFVRLKRDVAGSTRGTGLGLYICKQLVEAMNGRIWVESSGRPGEGSRFCLTLPPVSSL